ncbi:MAG TPA: zf-HC2 domain-containing protein [Candidatus Hydrogenedentes bacterium]|nr:zf-HC2 domain-containing protein [Candidatus Hydrogenedentota bacterium]
MKKLTCEQMNALQEAYLLETLSEREHRAAAAHLDTCPHCHEALEKARTRLAQLDSAASIAPPAGLAARTLARIAEEETTQEAQERRRPRAWKYAFVAALLIVTLLVVVPALEGPRSGRAYNIQNSLKQFGLAYKMYANESPGEVFPPVSESDGLWVPDLSVLYPEFLQDINILVPPDAPSSVRAEMETALQQEPPDYERAMRLMAQTYVYHGWITRDAEDVEEIKRFQIAGGPRNNTIVIQDGDDIYRLREGVERFMITDINNPGASAMAQSSLPIMLARPQSHRPGEGVFIRWWRRLQARVSGASAPRFIPTLFMDGHVEFILVEDAPPNVAAMLELLPEPLPE